MFVKTPFLVFVLLLLLFFCEFEKFWFLNIFKVSNIDKMLENPRWQLWHLVYIANNSIILTSNFF